MKTIVVAFDKARGIGADNDLLWLRDLPADLKHFKDLTIGHPIIMGRHTFQSISRPLPGRRNIVVSRTMDPSEGVEVVSSLEAAYELVGDENCAVIGGAQLYETALPTVDELRVTEVLETFPQATVFFPEIDPNLWQEIDREHHEADERNKYAYDFVRYSRR